MILQNYSLILFSIGLLNIKNCFCFEANRPKVAIIGAGIGGASASYFLTELFNKNVDIDVFESKTIGGRLATINIENKEFEAGGSVIHGRNRYMKDFVKLLKLQEKPPSSGKFGIWNGKEFVFEESNWEVFTLAKLLYKYGLQPFYLFRYINKILNDFDKIYELQDKGIGFDSVAGLLTAMNKEFKNLLQISIKDHLTNLGYGKNLIDELVKATLVVNYGQDTDVQAFVSCVSMAGADFSLWSVKGGNKEVPKRLIANNEKISLVHSTVKTVHRHSVGIKPKYEIFYKEKEKLNETSKIYDIVIIAAPMTSDQENSVIFNGFNKQNFNFPGEYQTTYATFVSGAVNFSYFGLDKEIDGIMSCNPVDTKISSIGKLCSVEGEENNDLKVWKIFSRKNLDNAFMNKIFSKIKMVKKIKWKAYPRYSSTTRLDNFRLDDSVYYVNAIEWAASAMEMSAISGRNAAILAFNDYQQKHFTSTTNKHSAS